MAAWVNLTILSGSSVDPNGTNSHTCTFTAATSGNFLVAVVAGAVTFTTPSGWTLVTSAIGNTGIYVFTKTASAGESSFSTTHNGSNYSIRGVIYEYFSGTSVLNSNSDGATPGVGATTGPVVSGLSGTYTRFAARANIMSSTQSTGDASWTLPSTENYDDYIARVGGLDGIHLTIAYDDAQTGASFTPSYTISDMYPPDSGESVAFALSVAASSSTAITAWLRF